jgi:hypothetical protein
MLSARLIEETDDRPAPDEDDSRRRYYRISGLGRHVLELEAQRLRMLVGVARDKKVIG